MVRVGSVMAMAIMAELLASEPEAGRSKGATAALDVQDVNRSGTGTKGHTGIQEGIGLGFVIVFSTPGHTPTGGIVKRTFGMFLFRPARAALEVERNSSSASARGPAIRSDGTRRNDVLAFGNTVIHEEILTITITIGADTTCCEQAYETMTLAMTILMTNDDGYERGATAAATSRLGISGISGTRKRSNPCILALTSPELLRRRRRACIPVTWARPPRSRLGWHGQDAQWIKQAANLTDTCNTVANCTNYTKDIGVTLASISIYIGMGDSGSGLT
jgi:hypothetical protein